jgi:hypothetical protein
MLNCPKKEKKKDSQMSTQQKSFGSQILNFDWWISTNQKAERHNFHPSTEVVYQVLNVFTRWHGSKQI